MRSPRSASVGLPSASRRPPADPSLSNRKRASQYLGINQYSSAPNIWARVQRFSAYGMISISPRCNIHERSARRVALRCNDCMPPVISPAIKAHAQMAQSDEQGLARCARRGREEGRKDELNFSLYITRTQTLGRIQRRRRPRVEALPSSPTHTPAVKEQTLSFQLACADTRVAQFCLQFCW